MSNKYQYADVINNGDHILNVNISGDALGIVYPANLVADLSWVGEFLNERGYALSETASSQVLNNRHSQPVNCDIYEPDIGNGAGSSDPSPRPTAEREKESGEEEINTEELIEDINNEMNQVPVRM